MKTIQNLMSGLMKKMDNIVQKMKIQNYFMEQLETNPLQIARLNTRMKFDLNVDEKITVEIDI